MKGYVSVDQRYCDLELKYDLLVKAARALADAMETCHICQSVLLVEKGPTYCESGCSSDCDDHDMPECVRIDVLHAALKRELKKGER